MAVVSMSRISRPLHPLHAIILGFPITLFLSALVSDIAYWSTLQIQWSNFSSWLIAGGLLVGGFAMLWALIDLFRSEATRRKHAASYFIVLLAMWIFGFINALIHAKDAFAIMPEAIILSVVATLLAFAAAWLGYSGFQSRELA